MSVSPTFSSVFTFIYSPLKFISYVSTIYFVSVFALQFALYVLFPILPFAIVTVVSGLSPLLPVHPINVYPVFNGLFNTMSGISTEYLFGFVTSSGNIPPVKSYVIVYIFIFAPAVNVISSAGIVIVYSLLVLSETF